MKARTMRFFLYLDELISTSLRVLGLAALIKYLFLS